jgi:citrate synthase
MTDYAKGLEGIVASETNISFIDGVKGVLEYVGIPIGELASKSTFEETVFLLWNQRLPKADELAQFKQGSRDRYELPAGMEQTRLLAAHQRPADARAPHHGQRCRDARRPSPTRSSSTARGARP